MSQRDARCRRLHHRVLPGALTLVGTVLGALLLVVLLLGLGGMA